MVGWFKAMVEDNATTLLSQIRERNGYFDMDRARGITCPTLLISGENSPERFTRLQDSLEPELPQSKRAVIALASHGMRSEEHTSEIQSLMRISYAGFCMKQHTEPKKTH